MTVNGARTHGVCNIASVDWASLHQSFGGAAEPLPKNDYDVEVVKAEAKTTSTDKLMFSVSFKVLTGPHANRNVYTNLVVSPDSEKAMQFFFRKMKALGLDKDFWKSQPGPDTVATQLTGKRARVSVIQREWNGEMRNDVENIKPPAVGASAPAAPAAPPAPAAKTAPPPPAPASAPAETASVAAAPPEIPF